MAAFLAMGGYAAYVWPAYGISLVALGGAVIWTLIAARRVRRQIAQRGDARP